MEDDELAWGERVRQQARDLESERLRRSAAEDDWDFDAWLGRTDKHIGNLLSRLGRPGPPSGDSHVDGDRLRGRKYYIDVATGHLGGLQLCWVCCAMPVHVDPEVPTLRACRRCLLEDTGWATRIGLTMLLPLMDWPRQPVFFGAGRRPGSEWDGLLLDAWTGVSVLDRWRRSTVQMCAAWMDDPHGIDLDLVTWQRNLGTGPNRSRACWRAFVEGYHAGLYAQLRTA